MFHRQIPSIFVALYLFCVSFSLKLSMQIPCWTMKLPNGLQVPSSDLLFEKKKNSFKKIQYPNHFGWTNYSDQSFLEKTSNKLWSGRKFYFYYIDGDDVYYTSVQHLLDVGVGEQETFLPRLLSARTTRLVYSGIKINPASCLYRSIQIAADYELSYFPHLFKNITSTELARRFCWALKKNLSLRKSCDCRILFTKGQSPLDCILAQYTELGTALKPCHHWFAVVCWILKFWVLKTSWSFFSC